MSEAEISELVARLERLDAKVNELKDLLLTQKAVKEHYTTEEVARIVGKAEFTVREWCRLGRIRAIKKWSGRGKHQGWAIPTRRSSDTSGRGCCPIGGDRHHGN